MLLSLTLFFLVQPTAAGITPGMITCGDFLGKIGKKPQSAVFIGCASQPDDQGKPLRAVYRVNGNNAAATESYLVKTFKLTRLRRSCCQWDGPPKFFVDQRGREMMISMVSEETIVSARSKWDSIATFEIVVDVFTEDV